MTGPSLADVVAMMPFAAHAGVEVTEMTKEQVRGRMEWSPERCTTFGVLHGAALMTLADTVGAVCASMHLPDGAFTTTIETKTNFFRPVTKGHVEAVSRPLHAGRTTIVVQTDLLDADGKRVAQTTQTQAVITRG